MKKTLAVLLSLFLVSLFAFSVSADVIWEPYGDSFFDDHRNEITYEGRFYRATRDLDFCKKPNGKAYSFDPIYADETFFVEYVYEDENGVLWGNCYHSDADSVWVDLSGSIRPYDRADFEEDYKDTFEEIASQPDAAFYSGTTVSLYDYPGCGSSQYDLYVNPEAEYLPEYAHTYTDPNGNVWGELYYYMAQRGWVLLEGDITKAEKPDKAEDTLIPARENTETTLANDESQTTQTAADSRQDTTQSEDRNVIGADTAPQKNNGSVLLPALLVAAVVAVSLVILFVFFRKKKKN